jgi:hypothetical protein
MLFPKARWIAGSVLGIIVVSAVWIVFAAIVITFSSIYLKLKLS